MTFTFNSAFLLLSHVDVFEGYLLISHRKSSYERSRKDLKDIKHLMGFSRAHPGRSERISREFSRAHSGHQKWSHGTFQGLIPNKAKGCHVIFQVLIPAEAKGSQGTFLRHSTHSQLTSNSSSSSSSSSSKSGPVALKQPTSQGWTITSCTSAHLIKCDIHHQCHQSRRCRSDFLGFGCFCKTQSSNAQQCFIFSLRPHETHLRMCPSIIFIFPVQNRSITL